MVDSSSLTQIIEILEPLSPEVRRRNIKAILAYFSDEAFVPPANGGPHSMGDGQEGAHFAPEIAARLKQNGISFDDVAHVFEFRKGVPFRILALSGKSKKAQTLAMYLLVGLGTFLETGQRDFTDATARGHCEDYGCYDQGHHAQYLEDKHPGFTGKKDSGWLLTVPGIKIAAEIVKEIAKAA